MIVFPAIDIKDGKAVRLRRGDFDDVTVFSDDPVELARYWRAEGAEAIHVVDLDAARTGELVNGDVLEKLVHAVDVPIQYGGGIRTDQSLALVAGLGVHWVVMGTAAITAQELLEDALMWLGDRLVVGMDCTDGMVATHGWQQRTQMSHALRFILENGRQTSCTPTRPATACSAGLTSQPRDIAEMPISELVLRQYRPLDDLRRLVLRAQRRRRIVGRAYTRRSRRARHRQRLTPRQRKRIIPASTCTKVASSRASTS
jgi:hypothetical protein